MVAFHYIPIPAYIFLMCGFCPPMMCWVSCLISTAPFHLAQCRNIIALFFLLFLHAFPSHFYYKILSNTR
jgi:hypothetical protein